MPPARHRSLQERAVSHHHRAARAEAHRGRRLWPLQLVSPPDPAAVLREPASNLGIPLFEFSLRQRRERLSILVGAAKQRHILHAGLLATVAAPSAIRTNSEPGNTTTPRNKFVDPWRMPQARSNDDSVGFYDYVTRCPQRVGYIRGDHSAETPGRSIAAVSAAVQVGNR
jgi:hypothetical protein